MQIVGEQLSNEEGSAEAPPELVQEETATAKVGHFIDSTVNQSW